MGSVNWGGAKIHYTERGEGPAVLFLHAFPLSASMWNKQTNALKDTYRTVAVDLPGFGKSERQPTPASMESFAQAALAVLDALEIKKAAVVGLSMGGYVAFELRAHAPERVSALVLCDTRATGDSVESRKAREATARAVEDDGQQVLAERMLPNLVSPAATPALKREIEKFITENPSDGSAAGLRALATRKDFTGNLKDISCPTLVIVGDHDTVTPPSDAQALAQAIPGAKYEAIPAAGHLSNLENHKAFDAVLRAFLDSCRDRL